LTRIKAGTPTPVAISDPIQAFPASLTATPSQRKEIQRDRRRRKAAVTRGWSGRLADGSEFSLFFADLYTVIRGSKYGDLIQEQLVAVRVFADTAPTDRFIIAPKSDFGMGLFSAGWYQGTPLLAGHRTVDFGRSDLRHEVRFPRQASEQRMQAAFAPINLDWLAGLDPGIRFEFIDGLLHGFQFEIEPKSLPDVGALIEATGYVASVIRAGFDHGTGV
jgi:hypothetical protein